MTIHYHGTPLSPRSELMKMAGKCFCVPFSDARDAETCVAIGQAVMFDNGKFGAHTRGATIDTAKLYAWLDRFLGHPHWAVVEDEIDGTVEEQRAMTARWPFPRQLSAPVWHMALPIEYLLELADGWPRICFGSTSQYWQVGSDLWCRRADEAFNELSKRHRHLPWVHMLRGMSLAGDRWPFASVDSVNVARNFKDFNHCPERMARRLDAVQCGGVWVVQPQQQDMFA
ncbi:hypothetical protein HAP47_0022890 [Bradyrhizobium sp. 41S5]|uniref:hypothetical protein n=1 Tax=Bradyrhizobium sp. 41S5 TaxID=1404443 RepID=UPI00156A9A6E|nr:hypothetical protein [Bradyrhizobium sp. 41S5]UFX42110.1 hypothetical protein HAP47_0022890 [Bradyrhizobium sp. 41S5]